MRGFKDAIGQLPSWPGFALGAAAIIGIGGWYYSTSYAKCADLRTGRAALHTAIVNAADSGTGLLDLAAAIPGSWDEVRIIEGHRPGQDPLNCPFGWDMTWRERQALIEAGQYTIVGFFAAGKFEDYIEYRSDWATFADPPKSIARAEARFDVARPEAAGKPYTLKLSR